MKFQCFAAELTSALQTATKALPTRTTNQILEGVLLQAEGDSLTLSCSDERITIVTHVHATVDEAGQGVIPGKLFGDMVRRLPDAKVDISADERNIFTIRSGAARMNISGQDGRLFPTLPTVESENEARLPQDMLRGMIQKVAYAISVDDARDVLTGCLLEIEHGDINMVGLDGYRMAMCHAKCPETPDRISAIIPGRAANEISSILTGGEEAFAQLSFSGNKLHIKLDDTEIYVMLIEGEYLKYRQLLPRSFGTDIQVALEPFRKSVDRAYLIARDAANKLVKLTVRDGAMHVEANSSVSDMHEELPIDQAGENVEIAFNVKYLMDMTKLISADTIEMRFNSPVAPCVVTPANSEDYIHLILPVRMSARG